MLQIMQEVPYRMKQIELQKSPTDKQHKILQEVIKQSSRPCWHETLFAVHNSQIVAAISFEHYKTSKITYICDIAVASTHQGQEIREKLIKAVTQVAKKLDQKMVKFHHLPIDPTFYQNMGFQIAITRTL